MLSSLPFIPCRGDRQPISVQQIELHARAVPHVVTRCGNRRISSSANVLTQPIISGTTASADSRVGSPQLPRQPRARIDRWSAASRTALM